MTTRPILFLDVDGVVNRRKDYRVTRTRSDASLHYDKHGPINPKNVDVLNVMLHKYDFEVVISSDWRVFGWEEVAAILPYAMSRGIMDGDWRTDSGWDEAQIRPLRGYQIEEWFIDNPQHIGRPYLAIDDDSEFFDFQPVMFTDPEEGLLPHHISLAAKHMHNGQRTKPNTYPINAIGNPKWRLPKAPS